MAVGGSDKLMAKRTYTLRARARRAAATRARIAAAAVELHSTVGPALATISAVAQRAGVQRHTVYAHFPDDVSLYRACVAHGIALWPLPDPRRWAHLDRAEERLAHGLAELYTYFKRTEQLWSNVTRDLPLLPGLQEANAPVFAHWDLMRSTLAAPWRAQGRRRRLVEALIGHFLALETWRSLVRVGQLSHRATIAVAIDVIASAARAGISRATPLEVTRTDRVRHRAGTRSLDRSRRA